MTRVHFFRHDYVIQAIKLGKNDYFILSDMLLTYSPPNTSLSHSSLFDMWIEAKIKEGKKFGNSLVVQWLGLCPLIAEGPGFNPWLGNLRFHKPPGQKKKVAKLLARNNYK